MVISFRDIAMFMDPAQPVTSLEELAERHRWLQEGTLPSPISFRRIAERHANSASTRHRFLWYNTALLPGFSINLCDPRCLNWIVEKAGVSPIDLLKGGGVGPTQVLEAFGIGKNSVVGAFGISLDQLKSAFEDVVNELISIITLGSVSLEDILDKVSLGDIVSKFNITLEGVLSTFGINPMDVIAKFCSQVLEFLGIPVTWAVGAQPDLDGRAVGISAMLAENDYNIAALCEVFTPQRQASILNGVKSGSPNRFVIGCSGPDSSGNTIDSGLYTVSFDRSLLYKEARQFNNRGSELIDADAWANKGVLLAVFDVGLGRLEVFSTHLISGGDLANKAWEWILEKVTSMSAEAYAASIQDHVLETKMAQIDDLLQFYHERHNPENMAIIVGDFNLDAHNPKEYGMLIQKMYGEGFKLLDSWPYHRRRPPAGQPNVNDAEKIKKSVAAPRGASHSDYKHYEVCSNDKGPYCDDSVQLGGGRIDFMFIERPQYKHSYTFDFTRVQRRPFFRNGVPSYLSDHLGLDVTFLVSPRMDH